MKCFTTRPGRCNIYEYRFQVNEDKPIVGYSCPIPFAVRPAVRDQIMQMLQDDILEISNSPFLNPLTVVYREGMKVRACVDARKVISIRYLIENAPHPYKNYYRSSKACSF
jgi:hypothetical protein